MGNEQGHSRRAATVKIGAFVVIVLLVLSIPVFAFAANTATFSSFVPRGGSTVSARPTVSVVVFDRFGVRGSSNYSLFIDGAKKSPRISYFAGFGVKKFRLSYAVPSNLSAGGHVVLVRVKDLAGRVSSVHWGFNVAGTDTTPPSTTNSALPQFPADLSLITLTATDSGSGVAHTYWKLDGGPQMTGTQILGTFALGVHTVEYWSVDNAGNVEPHHTVTWTVVPVHSMPTLLSVSSCVAVGCHASPDLITLHQRVGCVCHMGSTEPSNNCLDCHSGVNAPPFHTTHIPITSSAAPGSATDCANVGCHGTTTGLQLITLHFGLCATCHNPSPTSSIPTATVAAVIAAGLNGTLAHCEDCHGTFATIHAPGTPFHTLAAGVCTDCHGSRDASVIHTNGDDPPGCVACHAPNVTPSVTCTACHPDLVSFHSFTHPAASGDPATGMKSSACVACHGTDIPTVHARVIWPPVTGTPQPCMCHTQGVFRAEMAPLLTAWFSSQHAAECVDCHKGQFAPHGFASTATTPAVSGHNTVALGKVGAYSKFDGSQGPVLHWEAVETTTLAGFGAGNNGTYVAGQIATMTSAWDLPTANVFWSADSTLAPSTAMKGLTWSSVIRCQDCHTNLDLSMGPQGANAGQVGIDPNYPGDFSYAGLTKYVSRPDTTNLNPAWPSTSPNNAVPLSNSGIAMFPGALTGTPITTASLNATPAGASKPVANRTDGTTGPTAVICAKCHDLENFSAASGAVEGANTAHDAHHMDQVDGSPQCVNCHIAIPHGWIRPRLLVDTDVDAAPYLDPKHIGTTRTSFGAVINPLTGFNGVGMRALSGVNDHPLIPASGVLPYVTGSGLPTSAVNLGHVGTVLWDESECEACGFHEGENAPAKVIP